MCLRPKSLTLAMPLHWLCIIIYHIYGKLRNLRTTDKFEWLLNSRTHCQYDKWDIHKMMFTSYCLTILQDAGSGCDWVWLETVFWLELDNAWSSPPSSGAVMFCMADITPPVGILSTIFGSDRSSRNANLRSFVRLSEPSLSCHKYILIPGTADKTFGDCGRRDFSSLLTKKWVKNS